MQRNRSKKKKQQWHCTLNVSISHIGARFNIAQMATRAFEIRMAAPQGALVLLIGVVAVDGAKTKPIEFMACLLTQNIVPDTYVHFQRYSNDQCVK